MECVPILILSVDLNISTQVQDDERPPAPDVFIVPSYLTNESSADTVQLLDIDF